VPNPQPLPRALLLHDTTCTARAVPRTTHLPFKRHCIGTYRCAWVCVFLRQAGISVGWCGTVAALLRAFVCRWRAHAKAIPAAYLSFYYASVGKRTTLTTRLCDINAKGGIRCRCHIHMYDGLPHLSGCHAQLECSRLMPPASHLITRRRCFATFFCQLNATYAIQRRHYLVAYV